MKRVISWNDFLEWESARSLKPEYSEPELVKFWNIPHPWMDVRLEEPRSPGAHHIPEEECIPVHSACQRLRVIDTRKVLLAAVQDQDVVVLHVLHHKSTSWAGIDDPASPVR